MPKLDPEPCAGNRHLPPQTCWQETSMTLSTLLLIILILALLGALPSWPYSRGWGYGPSGILGLVLVVVLIMALMGRTPA